MKVSYLFKMMMAALAVLSLTMTACAKGEDPGCATVVTGQPTGPIIHRTHLQPGPYFGDDAGVDSPCDDASDSSTSSPFDLTYHGGPVLVDGTVVYLIWYGNWSGNSATSIIPDFVEHLGGSPYFQINTAYYGKRVEPDAGYDPEVDADALPDGLYYATNGLKLGYQVFDSYSRGTSLEQEDVLKIVVSQIELGTLPVDVEAVYVVIGSADVKQFLGGAEFCEWFCGWHDRSEAAGIDLKYIYIGDVSRCTTACAPDNPTISPNDNVGADGMASILAHELDESVTDPDLNAWYYGFGSFGGQENGDKCAWTFGTTWKTTNGSTANLKLDDKDYYIQQNWVLPDEHVKGHCGMIGNEVIP